MAARSDANIDILEEPRLKPVKNAAAVLVSWQYVFVAINTTGSNIYEDEICQLGLYCEGEEPWCQCILPEKNFETETTKHNGFSKENVNGKLALFWRYEADAAPVPTHRVKDVIKSFRERIQQIASRTGKKTLLMVYNDHDVSFLFRTIEECDLSSHFLKELNGGFVHVSELVESMKSKLPGIKNLKQGFNDPHDERHTAFDVNRHVMTLFHILNDTLPPIPLETYLKHSSTAKSQYKEFKRACTWKDQTSRLRKRSRSIEPDQVPKKKQTTLDCYF